ncbi:MAG: hypothetical protein K8I27_00795 [Planctomycetes bacterium]|nr:hypothetical protein [Planctomycetota bacterium]
MKTVPYGSVPPPKAVEDVATLQQIVRVQSEQMQVAQRDITELKDLARRLNTKYETEQKRMRQFQETILLANAQARNLVFQNEDVRQRLQQIESHGIEQRHVHTVRLKQPPEGVAVTVIGIVAILGMFLMLLYAVAATIH